MSLGIIYVNGDISLLSGL